MDASQNKTTLSFFDEKGKENWVRKEKMDLMEIQRTEEKRQIDAK